MSESLKTLNGIGWLCIIAGGFSLGASIGGTDRTIAAALFYGVAVFAFAAKETLSPANKEG